MWPPRQAFLTVLVILMMLVGIAMAQGISPRSGLIGIVLCAVCLIFHPATRRE